MASASTYIISKTHGKVPHQVSRRYIKPSPQTNTTSHLFKLCHRLYYLILSCIFHTDIRVEINTSKSLKINFKHENMKSYATQNYIKNSIVHHTCTDPNFITQIFKPHYLIKKIQPQLIINSTTIT